MGADGQLGEGRLGDENTPVFVVGGLNFTRVSVGGIHSCGVTASGDGYCWGYNGSGELGDGTAMPRYSPVKVLSP